MVMVEHFGLINNLMLEGAARGSTPDGPVAEPLTERVFQEAVAIAKRVRDNRAG